MPVWFDVFAQIAEMHCSVLLSRFVREKEKLLEEEAKVMANVVGWKVGENVYNSGRWMPPATGKLGMDS